MNISIILSTFAARIWRRRANAFAMKLDLFVQHTPVKMRCFFAIETQWNWFNLLELVFMEIFPSEWNKTLISNSLPPPNITTTNSKESSSFPNGTPYFKFPCEMDSGCKDLYFMKYVHVPTMCTSSIIIWRNTTVWPGLAWLLDEHAKQAWQLPYQAYFIHIIITTGNLPGVQMAVGNNQRSSVIRII